ncbi:CLUMA_CG014314, isoform A [Clunio marinus]|uniref:CLUMA_CG014314, isoform A n=1 Tax=Clunio marinus TaxID=568069 RepID=A0A1J1IP01_9DIPT|nr:CLUMA_CG014314, isoform A [Clunio marinus]
MLDSQELDEFLTELSQESSPVYCFDKPQRDEVKKLKSCLSSLRLSSKELLEEYKKKQQEVNDLKQDKDKVLLELEQLRRINYDLTNENVNNKFNFEQITNEMEENFGENINNYIELSKDYLSLLSDVTCFNNFEIKAQHNKAMAKTEKFLFKTLKGEYQKPKIINSKRLKCKDDNYSTTTRKSSRISKKDVVGIETNSKRRKIDIWDLNSISQVSSPAPTIPFNEETSDLSSEVDSSYSFNTFSIGNETSFTFLERQKSSTQKDDFQCKCSQLNNEINSTLISVGTNTDQPHEPPPSLPSLTDNFDNQLSSDDSITDFNVEENELTEKPSETIKVDAATETESIETEVKLHQNLEDRGTSPIPIVMCNQSTITIRSTTTRGTSTNSVVMKNCGNQFPEISIEKILNEFNFELPDCLSPIEDLSFESDVEKPQTRSSETITDYCNVNREIVYASDLVGKLKTERKSVSDECEEDNSDDKSFNMLGKVLFNLFLQQVEIEEPSEFQEIMKEIENFNSKVSSFIEPIKDLPEVMFDSLFPEIESFENSPLEDSLNDVLSGFDVEHEPIEIPLEKDDQNLIEEKQFTEFETPKSPEPFMMGSNENDDVTEIPTETPLIIKKSSIDVDSILEFCPSLKLKMVKWKQTQKVSSKADILELESVKNSIKLYFVDEWTDENLSKCLNSIETTKEFSLKEAIFGIVEDNKNETEIDATFTPPAPPLPHYQQKLILLIKKLSETFLNLPHILIDDFEEKLFKFENNNMELSDLRNLTYFYTSLADLFFEGDASMLFYFIVKSIYFFGIKAVPIVFVVVKAFPYVLPKKSLLLKKYSKNIDWENMTGLELSKVHLDYSVMDSLDLTVMYLLACIQRNLCGSACRKSHSHIGSGIRGHELFNFIQRFYGFPSGFMTENKLLEILIERLEVGEHQNLSMSLILLAKRASQEFTLETIVNKNLLPMLNKLVLCLHGNLSDLQTSQMCLLVECISSIIKPFPKGQTFKEAFPVIVSIVGRTKQMKIQETCIKAILRLQRLFDNHKEIYTIIKHYLMTSGSKQNDGLIYAIKTFIHRKNEKFFKA